MRDSISFNVEFVHVYTIAERFWNACQAIVSQPKPAERLKLTDRFGYVEELVVLQIQWRQLDAIADFFREMFKVIVRNVKCNKVGETTDPCGQLANFVFAKTEHRQICQVTNLIANDTDPVEAQEKSRERMQLVHYIWYLV